MIFRNDQSSVLLVHVYQRIGCLFLKMMQLPKDGSKFWGCKNSRQYWQICKLTYAARGLVLSWLCIRTGNKNQNSDTIEKEETYVLEQNQSDGGTIPQEEEEEEEKVSNLFPFYLENRKVIHKCKKH